MRGRNNKTYIIEALLAVVCIMTVAYAAFSTSLTINASSSIDSTWSVKYDSSSSAAIDYVVTNGIGDTSDPNTTASAANTDVTMTLTDTLATLSAKLYQPGDKVVFTLTVRNEGSLKASLSKSTITGTGCTVSGSTCDNGHIKFTVGDYSKSTLSAVSGSTVDTATIQVTAEFMDVDITSLTASESASISIPLTAVQIK